MVVMTVSLSGQGALEFDDRVVGFGGRRQPERGEALRARPRRDRRLGYLSLNSAAPYLGMHQDPSIWRSPL